jgi:ABC-2 type transport system ATP-binding protein
MIAEVISPEAMRLSVPPTTCVPAIKLLGVSKSYNGTPALQDVSFTVKQGEIMGFLGPNGAGKTTAIRILLDLIRADHGHASIMGLDSRRDSVAARRLVGYLPGELQLYEDMTGQQTIDYFKALRPGAVDEAYVRSLADRLDFDTHKAVKSYSKGNKQKLGLLLTLMHRPRVLLLDEPTSGLDPLVQETVGDLLEEATACGATVFFSSHVLSEVERMCHRVAFLRAGRLIAVEDVASLKGRSLHLLEVTFRDPPPASVFSLNGVREVERHGQTVHLEVREGLDGALKAISRYEVLDLRTEQPSLEQIFLTYYEGAHDEPQR